MNALFAEHLFNTVILFRRICTYRGRFRIYMFLDERPQSHLALPIHLKEKASLIFFAVDSKNCKRHLLSYPAAMVFSFCQKRLIDLDRFIRTTEHHIAVAAYNFRDFSAIRKIIVDGTVANRTLLSAFAPIRKIEDDVSYFDF